MFLSSLIFSFFKFSKNGFNTLVKLFRWHNIWVRNLQIWCWNLLRSATCLSSFWIKSEAFKSNLVRLSLMSTWTENSLRMTWITAKSGISNSTRVVSSSSSKASPSHAIVNAEIDVPISSAISCFTLDMVEKIWNS